MTKYIIFNTIKSGELDTFYHMRDIVSFLQSHSNPLELELVLIVRFINTSRDGYKLYNDIQSQVNALGVTTYFGFDHSAFVNPKSEGYVQLKQHFDSANQILIVAYDSVFSTYQDLIPKTEIPIKYISEIDAASNRKAVHSYCGRDVYTHGMGLYNGDNYKSYGIKIPDLTQIDKFPSLLSDEKFWAHFESIRLAVSCRSAEKPVMIPCLLGDLEKVFRKIIPVLEEISEFKGKDIILCYFGTELIRDFTVTHMCSMDYAMQNIDSKVDICSAEGTLEKYNVNKKTSRTISMLCFPELSPGELKKLYDMSPFTIIDSDQQFSFAIANKTLPIYFNNGKENKTLYALSGISNQLSRDSQFGFSMQQKFIFLSNFFKSTRLLFNDDEDFNKLLLADIKSLELKSNWQFVCEFIECKHNFFDNIWKIMDANLGDGRLRNQSVDSVSSSPLSLLRSFSSIFFADSSRPNTPVTPPSPIYYSQCPK